MTETQDLKSTIKELEQSIKEIVKANKDLQTRNEVLENENRRIRKLLNAYADWESPSWLGYLRDFMARLDHIAASQRQVRCELEEDGRRRRANLDPVHRFTP